MKRKKESSKKSKTESDFKKPKIKLGRKIKKHLNLTKPVVNAKSLITPISSISNDVDLSQDDSLALQNALRKCYNSLSSKRLDGLRLVKKIISKNKESIEPHFGAIMDLFCDHVDECDTEFTSTLMEILKLCVSCSSSKIILPLRFEKLILKTITCFTSTSRLIQNSALKTFLILSQETPDIFVRTSKSLTTISKLFDSYRSSQLSSGNSHMSCDKTDSSDSPDLGVFKAIERILERWIQYESVPPENIANSGLNFSEQFSQESGEKELENFQQFSSKLLEHGTKQNVWKYLDAKTNRNVCHVSSSYLLGLLELHISCIQLFNHLFNLTGFIFQQDSIHKYDATIHLWKILQTNLFQPLDERIPIQRHQFVIKSAKNVYQDSNESVDDKEDAQIDRTIVKFNLLYIKLRILMHLALLEVSEASSYEIISKIVPECSKIISTLNDKQPFGVEFIPTLCEHLQRARQNEANLDLHAFISKALMKILIYRVADIKNNDDEPGFHTNSGSIGQVLHYISLVYLSNVDCDVTQTFELRSNAAIDIIWMMSQVFRLVPSLRNSIVSLVSSILNSSFSIIHKQRSSSSYQDKSTLSWSGKFKIIAETLRCGLLMNPIKFQDDVVSFITLQIHPKTISSLFNLSVELLHLTESIDDTVLTAILNLFWDSQTAPDDSIFGLISLLFRRYLRTNEVKGISKNHFYGLATNIMLGLRKNELMQIFKISKDFQPSKLDENQVQMFEIISADELCGLGISSYNDQIEGYRFKFYAIFLSHLSTHFELFLDIFIELYPSIIHYLHGTFKYRVTPMIVISIRQAIHLLIQDLPIYLKSRPNIAKTQKQVTELYASLLQRLDCTYHELVNSDLVSIAHRFEDILSELNFVYSY